MQLVKLQAIPFSPYRSGQTSKGHVFPVILKSTAAFVLVMTTPMQVEALTLLEEHVLAKYAVPALRAVAGLAPGMSPRGAAWQWLHGLDISAEGSGKRHVTGGKLSFCKTKISTSSRHLCPGPFRKILKSYCSFHMVSKGHSPFSSTGRGKKKQTT